MSNVLEINNLTKFYGNIRALHQVNLNVPTGTVYGILGPNGSGKTTMLGIIMNTVIPTSGEVKVFGETPTALHRKKFGTLLETPNFYHYLNAVNNLKLTAAIKGITDANIDEVLKTVNLYERRKSPFSSYSLGMKQRLAIAACLLGNPEVMIFDEPTNGLDPNGIAEIRQLIIDVAAAGKTIIMASHMLDEVEKVCTHVAILKKGELLASGAVHEILAHDDIIELGAENIELLSNILKQFKKQKSIHTLPNAKLAVHVAQNSTQLSELNQYCFEHGVVLNHLMMKRKSLEAKFMELTNN